MRATQQQRSRMIWTSLLSLPSVVASVFYSLIDALTGQVQWWYPRCPISRGVIPNRQKTQLPIDHAQTEADIPQLGIQRQWRFAAIDWRRSRSQRCPESVVWRGCQYILS